MASLKAGRAAKDQVRSRLCAASHLSYEHVPFVYATTQCQCEACTCHVSSSSRMFWTDSPCCHSRLVNSCTSTRNRAGQ